jgi:hypothetical protein
LISTHPPIDLGGLTPPTPATPAGGSDPFAQTVDYSVRDAGAVAELLPSGAMLGPYRVERLLGEGGMGRVYEAIDPTDRRVAVKVIGRKLGGSEGATERFLREAKLASSIHHPRCVFVFEARDLDGEPAIVMELMPGGTLRQRVERLGTLPFEEAIRHTLGILQGLVAAHQLGILHRDVNPSNCYLDERGEVKVGDFGLARAMSSNNSLTNHGMFVGTPLFASPEQLKGDKVDPQTDVYSTAATLYFLVTGRAPHQDATGPAAIARAVSDPPPPPSRFRAELPPALERIILRGLEIDRSRRYRRPEDMAAALEKLLPPKLVPAPVRLRFAAALGEYFLILPIAALFEAARHPFGIDGFAWHFSVWHMNSVFAVTLVLWYALWEWRLGATPAKWFAGLKVVNAVDLRPPPLRRLLLRAFVFAFLAGWFVDLALFIPAVAALPFEVFGLLMNLLIIGGPLLTFSTMWPTNGWRGLHEFASGTKVMLQPPRRSADRLAGLLARCGSCVEARAVPADAPTRIGPFDIVAASRWDAGGRILLGLDPTLNRQVVVEVRDSGAAPLGPERMELARPARLRLIGHGVDGGWTWTASIAPDGIALPRLLREVGPLDWTDTRRLLHDLADELARASADGTIPTTLSADQILVSRSGQVVLLDVANDPDPREPTFAASETVAFLGLIARRCLETRRAGGDDAPAEVSGSAPPAPRGPIRAFLPPHARPLIDQLSRGGFDGARAIHVRLDQLLDLPGDVTRLARLWQVAAAAIWLVVPIAIMTVVAYGHVAFQTRDAVREAMVARGMKTALESGVDHPMARAFPEESPWRTTPERVSATLEQRVTRADRTVTALTAGLGVFSRLLNVSSIPKLEVKSTVSEKGGVVSARFETGNGGNTWMILSGEALNEYLRRVLSGADLTPRDAIRQLESATPSSGPILHPRLLLEPLVAIPLTAVLLALIVGTPIPYRLSGLAIVTRTSVRAGRLRLAARSLLFWLPILTLTVAITAIIEYRPEATSMLILLQAALFTWVAGCVASALIRPKRGLHDVLVGTAVEPE